MDHFVWVEKSTENLVVAEWCHEYGHFNACANRLYYAMFHAALAALIKHGINPTGNNIGHDWVQANFSGQLIHRRKLFSAKFSSHLSEALLFRIAGDYRDFPVSKHNSSRELRKARDFVRSIHEAIS